MNMGGPPTFGIRRTRNFGIGNRTDDRADLRLQVALDGGLGRAARFFSPDEGDLRARFGMFAFEHRKREHTAFVRAVAAPGGDADQFAVAKYLVVGQRGVHGGRKIEVFGPVFLSEHGADGSSKVGIIECERDFLPMGLG